MEISTNQIADEAIKAIRDKIKNLTRLNIAIVGKSGVGKSTLINSMFRDDLAKTGKGMPVTQEFREITKEDYPLSIFDTPGFELGKNQQDNVKKELLALIQKRNATRDINQYIHCIWYCVNTTSDRIEPEEEKWLREFTEENEINQVPVIVILTKSYFADDAEEMKKYIEGLNLNIISVVPVLAKSKGNIEAFGLDTLLAVMEEALPRELRDSLNNVQIASLEAKKKAAQAAVAAAVTVAFAEGFSPIPFSDASLLVPTQVAMIASITAIFGVDISKSIITGFVSSTLGAGGATILGKTAVSNILKLIPGAGIVLGGTISGTTAGLLTTALGESYIQLMIKVYNGEISKSQLETSRGQEELKAIFKSELKKERKNISKREKINV